MSALAPAGISGGTFPIVTTSTFTGTTGAVETGSMGFGTTIKTAFTDVIVPKIKAVWSLTLSALTSLFAVVKLGPTYPIAITSTLLLVGIASSKLSDTLGQNNCILRTALDVICIASVTIALISAGMGVAAFVIV